MAARPCATALPPLGESIGPFSIQNVSNPPLRAKDFSESDLHIDPTNAQHLIGISKWIVNSEGYNHLTGFFESFDGGATWPQLGHIPGYEGWTDNSDPVGAFDPWGNFYAVVFPYQFSYTANGQHVFLSPDVNPPLPRSGLGIAVRPHGAADGVCVEHDPRRSARSDRRTPFAGKETFDKQWLAIDTNRRSPTSVAFTPLGRSATRTVTCVSTARSRMRGKTARTRTGPAPRLVLPQTLGVGDNGSLPRVAPNGTVWLTMTSFRTENEPFTMSLTSSRNGGRSWTKRRVIVRHTVDGYRNTTFRAAFGEAFVVGPRKVGRFYPLYVAYEHSGLTATRLFIRGSFDGGKHWSRAIQVNDAPGAADALQPNLAVAPGGTVSVAFYDRRLPCPALDTPEATIAGLRFDPRVPYGRANYCINTAIQFYGAEAPAARPQRPSLRAHVGSPAFVAALRIASAIRRASSATTSGSTRAEVSPTPQRSRPSTPRARIPATTSNSWSRRSGRPKRAHL